MLYFVCCSLGDLKERKNRVYFICKTNFSFVWQRFFRLINRMQPPTPDNPNRLLHHRRSGLGHNTKDWTIELVCVYFSKFSVPFFLFLASSRWFSLSVVNLFTCIIFVCPIFIRPLAFPLKLVSLGVQCVLAVLAIILHCAYYAAHPLHYSPYNIHITHTTYLIICMSARVGILDCFHSNTRSHRL